MKKQKSYFGIILGTVMMTTVFCFVVLSASKQAQAADWSDTGLNSIGGNVSDLIQAADGSIYAGGYYYTGSVYYAKVWKYSNNTWSDTGLNSIGGNVGDLVQVADGSIYANGYYNFSEDSYPRVWKYSNNTWSDTGLNINRIVDDSDIIQAADGSIYVSYTGGNIEHGESSSYRGVWKYSNNTWSDTGFNFIEVHIYDLIQAADGSIYAGGYYYHYPEFGARVWKYSNNNWSDTGLNPIGGGVYDLIQAADGSIYAGGSKVWKYSNNTWSDTGFNFEGTVYGLIQAADGLIYARGDYNSQYARVWKYSNNTWSDTVFMTIGTSSIDSLIELNGVIFAAGSETVTSGYYAAKVWTYSNNAWKEETLGISNNNDNRAYVFSLILGNDGVYAGGRVDVYAKVWKRAYSSAEQRLQEEKKLEEGDPINLVSVLNKHSISGQDLTILFTQLPTKLTKNSKYWMKWNKVVKNPKGWNATNLASAKAKTLKKYWKLTTNLKSYKAKKKSQKFKIKVTFHYTAAEFKALKKKNKLAKEKNLYLLYKKSAKNWKSLSEVWNDAKITHNVKKNTFTVKYFTKFPKKTYYFGIGLK